MKIVIDISEEGYKRIMDGRWIGNPLADYIEDGTPLPKGHGDLIDADELFLDIQTDEQMRLGEHLAWVKERIDNAQTIIEADKEKEK